MRAATFLAGLAAVAMFAFVAQAIAAGSFWADGSLLFSHVWGRVTLADLYLGFALFSSWVVFREASLLRALLFVGLVMTLGNAFAALYVVVALVRSRGSWPRFWLGHRLVAAASLLAASLLAGHAVRAAPNAGGVDASGDGTPAAELRARFAGYYRYAAEQRARAEAIDRSVATLFFAVRGIARAKVDARTRIMPTCRFEFSGGDVRSTVPGLPVAVSPETGAPAAYRVDDDAIVLSQHFEGPRLVQSFAADQGGTRKNELTLSPDGARLTMKATLSSPKLSVPVVYTLTYLRVE